jgi:hypothetical protein
MEVGRLTASARAATLVDFITLHVEARLAGIAGIATNPDPVPFHCQIALIIWLAVKAVW